MTSGNAKIGIFFGALCMVDRLDPLHETDPGSKESWEIHIEKINQNYKNIIFFVFLNHVIVYYTGRG